MRATTNHEQPLRSPASSTETFTDANNPSGLLHLTIGSGGSSGASRPLPDSWAAELSGSIAIRDHRLAATKRLAHHRRRTRRGSPSPSSTLGTPRRDRAGARTTRGGARRAAQPTRWQVSRLASRHRETADGSAGSAKARVQLQRWLLC
jgi:hypothetical protein